MAWQTPKTNWQSGDSVTNDDFNRIEGNIEELNNVTVKKDTPCTITAQHTIDTPDAPFSLGTNAQGKLVEGLNADMLDGKHADELQAAGPNILDTDPTMKFVSLFGSLSGSYKWRGGVLAPNGKIYGIPYDSTQVLEIDPETQGLTLFGSLSGDEKWAGGVLAPNGKIYGIPHNATQILEIDPETHNTTLFDSLPSDTNKWRGGVLAPNGKIYGIPLNSTQVLEIDPETQSTTLFGSLSGDGKWTGGILAPNGKIYGIPYNING